MDFKDSRSMKVAFVPHCVLNQNARSPTTATCPVAEGEFIAGLIERGLGIVQMPCPELMVVRLGRGGDESIRSALSTIPGRAACRRMCKDLVYQIKEYQSCDVDVLGIFGKVGSPSCGVETTYCDGKQCPGTGVFIEELQGELKEQDIVVPIVDFLDNQPQDNLTVVDRWASRTKR